MKKTLFLLSFCALFVQMKANDSGQCGANLNWSFNSSNGSLTITGSGAMYDFPYTKTPWYAYASQVTSVSLPQGLTSIGEYAFMMCKMKELIIPEGVTKISYAALYGCTQLSHLVVPSTALTLGDGIFYGCNKLVTAGSIGSGCNYEYGWTNTIPTNAFDRCDELSSLTIANTITTIEADAVTYLDGGGLFTLSVPSTVTSIGKKALAGVFNVEYNGTATGAPWGAQTVNAFVEGNFIYADATKTKLLRCNAATKDSISIVNSVDTIANEAFEFCKKFTKIEIPNSVTYIESRAFSSCYNLKEITIPNSVLHIGERTFSHCHNLATIDCYLKSPLTINNNVFEDVPSSCLLIVNPGTSNVWKNASNWNALTIVEREDAPCILAVGDCGENITWTLSCDNTLTIQGSGAMNDYQCEHRWRDPATKKDSIDYSMCAPWYTMRDSIKSIIIEEGITSVGSYSFKNCDNVVAVSLPNTLNIISSDAFADCANLHHISLPNNLEKLGNRVFGHTPIDTLIIPGSVKSIGSTLFYGSKISCVIFSEGIDTLGNSMFYGCGQLRQLSIPSTVTSIGSSFTSNMINLDRIEVAKGNKVYDSRENSNAIIETYSNTLIAGCKSTIIPTSITKIGQGAFELCDNLDSITIPASVTTLEGYAFYHCISMKQINCLAINPPSCGSLCFKFVDKSIPIYVPSKSIKVYKSANGWSEFTNILPLNDIVYVDVATSVNDDRYGSVEGAGTYEVGEVITLIATPSKGYQFTQWSDSNTENPRQVVVTSDTTFTAQFAIKQCSWLVESSDLEMGAVYTSFTNSYYTYGTQITVNATPNSGYKFVKWNDGKKYNPYTFTLLDDKYLLAIFMAEDEEQDTTTVQPKDTTATFQWPLIEGGYTYKLTIYADATCTKVICTLTFNQYGQLIGIAFGAPRRGGLSSQEESFTCTVNGLETGQEYFYKMETTDVDGKLINTDEGGFTTSKNVPSYLDQLDEHPTNKLTKIIKNGQLLILRDGKTFNAQGAVIE